MSLEPDPNIEKLLADYAKERREKAGAPLELHPANRKLLQAEVERKFGQKRAKTVETALKGNFFGRFWPRLALAGGAVAIVVCFVVLHEKPSQKMAVFAKNERVADVSKTRTVSGKELRTDQPARLLSKDSESIGRRNETSKLFVAPAAPAPAAAPKVINAPMEASKDLLALQDRDRNQPVVARDKMLASNASHGYVANDIEIVTNNNATSLVAGGFAVNGFVDGAVLSSNNPTSMLSMSTEARAKEPQAQSTAGQTQFFKQPVVSPAHPKVLVNFELERQGQKVQIVDFDGSVYSGTLAEADNLGTLAFSVSGTNVTLNQSVAFAGTFYSGAEALATMGETKRKMAVEKMPAGAVVQGAAKTQKARISGRVQVGGTTGFSIDAKEVE